MDITSTFLSAMPKLAGEDLEKGRMAMTFDDSWAHQMQHPQAT